MIHILGDVLCADCGTFIGSLPLDYGKEFYCIDCAEARMRRIGIEQQTTTDEDFVFDLMKTNKGTCTY